MMGADSAGRRLLFPRALPSIPVISGGKDHERKRKIAVKCLELEEMLERQGHSQTEIETKVASFRALLLRQVTSINNNGLENTNTDNNASVEDEEDEDGKKENGKSWSEEEVSDSRQSVTSEKKKEKKRKKRSKHSKARKKKESRRRRLSSPSYSDYEPENPFLRNKRRKELVEDSRSSSKVSSSKKDKKKKKRKHSVSRSRSSSRSRKSRYEAKNTKKKTKRRRHSDSADNSGCSSSEKRRSVSRNGAKSARVNGISNDTADKREEGVATIIEKKAGSRKSSKRRTESPLEAPETASSIFNQEATGQVQETSGAGDSDSQYQETGSCSSNQLADNEGDSGKIIFSRIEDIPTQSENPRFVNIADSKIGSEQENGLKCGDDEGCSYTKLKFEINFLNKKPNLATKPLSTFAELSNKLGPTVNLNSRKLPPPLNQKPSNNDISANKSSENGVHFTDEKEKNEVKENGFVFDVASANTVAEDMDLDDEDEDVGNVISVHQEIEDDEIVILKTSKSRSKSRSPSRSRSRSRSRSYSYSRSRSRSYSYSSYSRSRSRGYSYSRSRSRSRSYSYSSYSSRSRSRTRSRSPSIPRRRGSPSFLDKRRITSARKRPIPYHRATPPTSPSSSDYESSDDERPPVRSNKNQSK